MRLFVLLSLLATATLGKITQSDLRSIFTHHQEYCREKHARIGVGGIERKHRTTHSSSVCQQSLDHEWHINTEETLDEEVFQAQLQHRVSDNRISVFHFFFLKINFCYFKHKV
jgi:hypothetical protein